MCMPLRFQLISRAQPTKSDSNESIWRDLPLSLNQQNRINRCIDANAFLIYDVTEVAHLTSVYCDPNHFLELPTILMTEPEKVNFV